MKNRTSRAVVLDGDRLTLSDLERVARAGVKVTLGRRAIDRMKASRAVVERAIAGGLATYGVNTGFGHLSDVRIPDEKIRELQYNLLRSHAAGVGEPLPEAETRAVMLLRANVLARGCSGARPLVASKLIELLNAGVLPFIPSQGSVGASGDLAPLAHLALVLIGEGEVLGPAGTRRRRSGKAALKAAGIEPLRLEAKEGLALINGTQVMTGIGALALLDCENLLAHADIAGAMSLEALRGSARPFDERIHRVRPQRGQIASAANLRRLLEDSEIMESHRDCGQVQDSYALRCMPQVHGAGRNAAAHVREVLEIEINSATDNPLVFAGEDLALSNPPRRGARSRRGVGAEDPEGIMIPGGNFHGQPVAAVLDYLAIAMTSVASISERRTDRLVNPLVSGLPAFLVREVGLNSGFMLAQVTSAALVSENKILSHPASVDSIPTSANKEDHVSMGPIAARKAAAVAVNTRRVIAIELLAAAQALDFLEPLKPAKAVARAHGRIREEVSHMRRDRFMAKDIEAIDALVASGELIELLNFGDRSFEAR